VDCPLHESIAELSCASARIASLAIPIDGVWWRVPEKAIVRNAGNLLGEALSDMSAILKFVAMFRPMPVRRAGNLVRRDICCSRFARLRINCVFCPLCDLGFREDATAIGPIRYLIAAGMLDEAAFERENSRRGTGRQRRLSPHRTGAWPLREARIKLIRTG
jgi:hypothetical protein